MSSTARNIDYKMLARLLQEYNRYKEIGSVENQTSFILDKLLREKKNRPLFSRALRDLNFVDGPEVLGCLHN